MLKLRTILLYKNLYILIAIFITFISLIYCNSNLKESKHNVNEKNIKGYITNIKIDGNKITLNLKTKEKIIITYYAKSKTSLEYIRVNYKLGDYITLTGEMTKIKDNRVFNLFNYRKYLYRNDIFFIFEATSMKKIKNNTRIAYEFKQTILDRISNLKYSGKSVKAFAIGDPYLIDSEIMKTYQSNGISHLLALSGANVALLALVLIYILKTINLSEIKTYLIVIVILFIYVFIANYTASIVRAFLFFSLLAINKIMYFHIKAMNILLLTYSILLIVNPYYLYDLGFHFSFIISFYLLLFQKYIEASNNKIVALYRVSLISFLVSLPITIYTFYQVNMLAVIYNLFFVPLVSLIIYPLSLIVIIFPILDYPLHIFISLMEEASLLCDKINFSKIIFAKPNFIFILLYYLIITITLFDLKKRKYKSLLLLIVILIIHSNINVFNNNPTLTMLDVGQGDCFLISLAHNKGNILIDTGGKLPFNQENYQTKNKNYSISLNTIIPYLKSIGIKKLDYLILTHSDYDHMGEANMLVANFNVKKIIVNNYGFTDLKKELYNNYYKKIEIKKDSDIITINDLNLYFLNPNKNSNENDNSLVIYTTIYKYKVLFMGDASKNIEENIIKKYNLKNIDILKIGHHGSDTSSSNIFLEYTNPKYALISVGEKNNFGHPHKEVINKLNDMDVKIYLTSKQGSLKLKFKPNQLYFSTCN